MKWGDWELYMTLRPASGLALYDIRWQGKRILYELALSEAQARTREGWDQESQTRLDFSLLFPFLPLDPKEVLV